MRYTVRCHNCSEPDVLCAELRDDQLCPRCQSAPGSYEVDGEAYCWLHRERLSATYPVSALFLFTTYVWRGQQWRFPNAKLFEAGDEGANGTSPFCLRCQDVLEKWLESRRAGGAG